MLKAIKRAKICMHACCNSMCDQNTRQHLRWISAVQHCKEFRIFINYKSYRTTESLNWKNHLVQLTTYHPLNCVLRCSTSLFLEYFQGCWPHHLPGQPAPMYHHCTQPEPGVPWGHQALITVTWQKRLTPPCPSLLAESNFYGCETFCGPHWFTTWLSVRSWGITVEIFGSSLRLTCSLVTNALHLFVYVTTWPFLLLLLYELIYLIKHPLQ